MRLSKLLKELWFALGSAVIALLLLYYLHELWLWDWALGCGFLAGVLFRRALLPTYVTFPTFLRRPLNLAVVLLGTIFAVWGTLAAPRFGGQASKGKRIVAPRRATP